MKQSSVWLLALLSILTLAATSTLAMAEDSAHLSGNVEVGVTGVDLKDNPARVNQYSKYRPESDGLNFAPSLSLEYLNKGAKIDIESEIRGSKDQNHSLELDADRVFKLNLDYDVFQYWTDHETLENLGATFTGDTFGDQPRVTTDLTAGQIPAMPSLSVLETANERYYEEIDNDYFTTHREWEGTTDITLPTLPNVTFHAGYRIEERQGYQQAITSSKCSQCHVQANAKNVDERTKDTTLGLTGKFGLLTVDYEYLHRDFDDQSVNASYNYLKATKIRAGVEDEDQLLYSGMQEYKVTPDSKKDSHFVEARLDLPRNSIVSATYVHADVHSDKDGEPGTYSLDTSTLRSEFESFFLKGATRIGGLRLKVRGGSYDINGPNYNVYFPDRDDMLIADGGQSSVENQDFDNPEYYQSAESREVTEFGIDAVYRLARGTTLRLDYEYEDVDRNENEFGDTKTNTYQVAIHSRLNKHFSGRISYEYQDIDDPFHGEEMTGIAQGIGETDPAYPGLEWLYTNDYRYTDDNPPTGAVYYWNSVYPNRTIDTTTEPDTVQEIKLTPTWTPSANMAITLTNRYRHEENDDVDYDQKTYVHGISFYYAPTSKMNLTMAYTFNKQETENQMCVGWYHG